MLREFEQAIDEILKEGLSEIPRGNVLFGEVSPKLPALVITNLGFQFDSSGLTEDVEQGRVENEEILSGNGSATSFRLKEKPMEGSVRAEHPAGTPLLEGVDFTVEDEGSLAFKKPPTKGKGNIIVKYRGRKGIVSLKVLKLKADYSFDVWHTDRVKADQVAEKLVTLLLVSQNGLSARGYELKLREGEMQVEQNGKATVVRVRCSMERELRVEQVVEIIDRVELSGKPPLS